MSRGKVYRGESKSGNRGNLARNLLKAGSRPALLDQTGDLDPERAEAGRTPIEAGQDEGLSIRHQGKGLFKVGAIALIDRDDSPFILEDLGGG